MTGQVYRIGRGTPAEPVNVSFDPTDQRRCQNLLTWFERGAEPGATLLIDDGPSRIAQPSTVVDLCGPNVRLIREGAIAFAEIERVLRAL